MRPGEVACPRHRVDVVDQAVGDGAGEAVRVAHRPGREVAPIRAAHDGGFLGVGIAPCDGLVRDALHVREGRAAPVAFDGLGVRLAVALGAARVGVGDDVALCSEPLKLVEQRVSILEVRPAVDIHHQGSRTVRLEVRRQQEPAGDRAAFAVV